VIDSSAKKEHQKIMKKWPQRLIAKVKKAKCDPQCFSDMRSALTLQSMGPMVPQELFTLQSFSMKNLPNATLPTNLQSAYPVSQNEGSRIAAQMSPRQKSIAITK
jgi:hypothetical protein